MPNHVADPGFDAVEAARGYRALVASIEATGTEMIDLLAALEAPSASPRFYLRDPHWTGRGVRAAAEHVAATLRERVALPEPRAFDVIEGRTAPLDAAPTRALTEACGIDLEEQRATALEARERTDDPDALFARDAPEVVVVGTSFTRDKYGFPARLSEALGMPVPGYAIGGGRVFASIDHYLASDPYHEGPPRVLLWEMRANLFGEEVEAATFERIVASVAPLCDSDDARSVGRRT